MTLPVPDDATLDAAALWVARSRDPAFADWAGLMAWLEAHPTHNAAYEAALDTHDAAGAVTGAVPTPRPLPAPRRSAWRRYAIGSLAAAIAVAVAVPSLMPADTTYRIATAPGQQVQRTLPDGTRIALNGGTTLTLDRSQPRWARLDRGEAVFAVVHDPLAPFEVATGQVVIRDVGTTFNIQRDARGLRVAVAEGEVLYDPAGVAVALNAGRSLRASDSSRLVEVSDVDAGAVGAWRSGRLLYRSADYATVAADIARSTGRPVFADPSTSGRRFTGGITLRGTPPAVLKRQLEALLGVKVVPSGGGWRLMANDGAAH
ncbi:FecR domain-containing protein [Sphingomonas naphthae]|uniref:FecR domain-containing protein n=1 Tax=Sphingomonas naphthae TaxID=1813468 RepID=A0ABY7TGW5_9SPHN|nr:FecR domain-containing protein [Sphingomonas naphthae]WCT72216.1 FecR domain-containing protein [Sphingomonas naphthae]